MTVQELYASVAQLGFENNLEYDDGFIFAANRALLQVNAIRPATRTVVINHRPLENAIENASFSAIEMNGDDLVFEATDVKAFYFEADGNGRYLTERQDKDGAWLACGGGDVSFKGFGAVRGFIKDGADFVSGRVRLRFFGDYVFTVKNVAMYRQLFSDKSADIPAYEPYTRYDLSLLTSDFLFLCSPPILKEDSYSRLNQGYDVENGRIILLPRENRGVYKIIYAHKPAPISNIDGTLIDIDEELASLLPLLVSAYVWNDDEPEKSEYYLSLYRERAADIERRLKCYEPVNIKNVYGW